MYIWLYVDGALIVTLLGIVLRLAYVAGLASQRLTDLSGEVVRLRDRVDRLLDPYKHPPENGC